MVILGMSCFTGCWKKRAKGGELLEVMGKVLTSLCLSQEHLSSGAAGLCPLGDTSPAQLAPLRHREKRLHPCRAPQLCRHDARACCELPACLC